jgi:glyoxylase-like metal-dependent hydrolase (beta-lactamase superfamily II)
LTLSWETSATGFPIQVCWTVSINRHILVITEVGSQPVKIIMKVSDAVRVAALAAVLFMAGQVQAQDESSITTQRLNDTVSVLFGQGGNIGVSAGPDGVFIIDDQYADVTDDIRAAIAAISDQPISYVINTHWHFDHAGGNENFGKAGSVIIAHDNVHKRMVTGGFIKLVDVDVPPAVHDALPVITFNDSMTLYLNGEEVQLLHVKSAHTDGDGVIWFKGSNIIHTGDVFINGIYPLADPDSGGTFDGLISATETILAIVDDQTQIIPGHGPVTDKAGLQAYRDMCIVLQKRIADMKKSGMSLEEVLAAAPTADFDAEWNACGLHDSRAT